MNKNQKYSKTEKAFFDPGLRGGDWNNDSSNLRVGDRNNATWSNSSRNNNIGLRPAQDYSKLVPAFTRALRSTGDPGTRNYYLMNQAQTLVRLKQELETHTYKPKPPQTFQVKDPKPRRITAPAFRDRVVHQFYSAQMEPILDKLMYPHSYACRKGMGTHRARDFCQTSLQQHQYVIKGDIDKFFACINHEKLLSMLFDVFDDPEIRWIVEIIIRSYHTPGKPGIGLPIGSLTSQVFANFYMNDFDWWISSHCETASLALAETKGTYLRYMDDFVIISDNPAQLKTLAIKAQQYLLNNLGLTWPNHKKYMAPARVGLPFLGQYLKPNYRRALGKRMRNALGKWEKTAEESGVCAHDASIYRRFDRGQNYAVPVKTYNKLDPAQKRKLVASWVAWENFVNCASKMPKQVRHDNSVTLNSFQGLKSKKSLLHIWQKRWK